MCLIRKAQETIENNSGHMELCRRFLEPNNADVYMRRLVHPPRAMIEEAFAALRGTADPAHALPTEDQQSHIGGIIFEMLSSLHDEAGAMPQNYDHIFFRTLRRICTSFAPSMTLGRTQWVINYFAMVYYCRYWSALDPAYTADNPWVRQYSPFFHIPVDGNGATGFMRVIFRAKGLRDQVGCGHERHFPLSADSWRYEPVVGQRGATECGHADHRGALDAGA